MSDKYDCVIVLNGGANDDGELFEDTRGRVLKGIETANKYNVANLIVAGHEAKEMLDFAKSQPNTGKLNIMAEYYSSNTVENAHYTKTKFLIPKGWRSVIVVTEKFHAGRSKMTFERVLGNDYKVKMIGSDANYSPKQRKQLAEQEKFFTNLTSKKLTNIKPDQDQKREAILESKREITANYFPPIRK